MIHSFRPCARKRYRLHQAINTAASCLRLSVRNAVLDVERWPASVEHFAGARPPVVLTVSDPDGSPLAEHELPVAAHDGCTVTEEGDKCVEVPPRCAGQPNLGVVVASIVVVEHCPSARPEQYPGQDSTLENVAHSS